MSLCSKTCEVNIVAILSVEEVSTFGTSSAACFEQSSLRTVPSDAPLLITHFVRIIDSHSLSLSCTVQGHASIPNYYRA